MPKGLLVRRESESVVGGRVAVRGGAGGRHFAYGDAAVFLSLPKSSSSASDSSCSPSYYQPSPLSDRSHSPSDEPQVLDLRICTINASLTSSPHKSLSNSHRANLVSRITVNKVTPFSCNRSNSSLASKKSDNNVTYKCPSKSVSVSGNEGKRKKSKTPVRSNEHKRIRSLVRKSDQTKNSPVSGTVILDSDDEEEQIRCGNAVRRNGDIDPSLNLVVVSEEARAELAKIKNTIGDYNCCLCHQKFEDAFALAQHSCPRIVHLEYRCPDCEKVFNCPANLASHRRWHKPRST